MLSRFLAVVITLGAILFAGWMALKRDDIPYEQLETIYASSDSRFLALDDEKRIHFRDVGPRDAPTLVLVHGFSASLHTWEPWVADLKRDYRIISLDLPGHGLSRCVDNGAIGTEQFVDIIDRVVDALKVERFTLAGNSMGGGAAWSYALAHPERLDGLVLVDAAGWPRSEAESKDRPVIFRLLEIGFARKLIKDLDMSSLIRSGLEDSFANPAFVTDEMVDRYASLARAPCHRDALLALSAGEGTEATAQGLAAISTPTLVMHGEKDNLIPASHGENFAAAIPGAELKLYPDVGHLPQEEIAAESVADLRSFLATRVYPSVTSETTPTN
ncbi:alpha/beta fold hydrolase [Hyphomonas sp. WL0036]|uniref:alpha/beta fold hydrolase n=1 Tax=Hyphomonas sediminis TaxID=2866160 RepID=UPI001C7F87E4|nr:alpha/beta fold hydrolase [Hyphomonas sediminis]MBY9066055.1 alpha/beta fold hydrolase [Hyphomonas sediminis]